MAGGIEYITVNELLKLHKPTSPELRTQAKPERACKVLVGERPMTAKETIAGLRERIAALITAGFPVREVVVWRNPGGD